MDVKKENNENIASKKEKMKMVINQGKNFVKTIADKHGWRNEEQQEQYYFMARILVLLEELVDDFYKTELDSADQLFIDQLFQKITTTDTEDNPKPNTDNNYLKLEKNDVDQSGFVVEKRAKSNSDEYRYKFEIPINDIAIPKIAPNLKKLTNNFFDTIIVDSKRQVKLILPKIINIRSRESRNIKLTLEGVCADISLI